jgi:hypothetical protein
MKKILFLASALLMVSLHTAKAQDGMSASGSDKFSFTVGLNQDVFFGFYPTLAGSYSLNPATDFTFYGILWNTPSFSHVAPSGFGLWTEFGVGLNFNLLDNQLSINPQIGFTNGSLLSSALQGRPVVGDGIVPNLTASLNTASLEGEFYGGYYGALRNIGEVQLDYLHYWLNGGVKIGPILSVGAHYEQLRNTKVTGGDASNVYQWIGPYAQIALPSGHSIRFSGGPDIVNSNETADFYKLTLKLNL